MGGVLFRYNVIHLADASVAALKRLVQSRLLAYRPENTPFFRTEKLFFFYLSHDVNGLPVSLTSCACFVVNEFFSVTVVKEIQVLLTTHKSTNISTFFFY